MYLRFLPYNLMRLDCLIQTFEFRLPHKLSRRLGRCYDTNYSWSLAATPTQPSIGAVYAYKMLCHDGANVCVASTPVDEEIAIFVRLKLEQWRGWLSFNFFIPRHPYCWVECHKCLPAKHVFHEANITSFCWVKYITVVVYNMMYNLYVQ